MEFADHYICNMKIRYLSRHCRYTLTCIVSIMDKVNQECGHQCVTHMYLYVQWYTARVHVMQLWLVITERLHLFCLHLSVIRALYCVANYVCFKGQLLLLIICDGGSSLHLYMADKHPTLCMVDSDEQFLNQHSFGCKIVRAWSSLLS